MSFLNNIKEALSSVVGQQKTGGKVDKVRQAVLKLIVVFMALGGAMLVTFIYEKLQSINNSQYAENLSEQGILSQHISRHAQQTLSGNNGAYVQLKRSSDRYANAISALKNGDDEAGFPAAPGDLSGEMRSLDEAWNHTKSGINVILGGQKAAGIINSRIHKIKNTLPGLMAMSEDISRSMITANVSGNQLFLAAQQISLLESISSSLSGVLSGDDQVAASVDRFERDVILFDAAVIALLNGSADLKIKPVESAAIKKQIKDVVLIFAGMKGSADDIFKNASGLYKLIKAVNGVQSSSSKLLGKITDFQHKVSDKNKTLLLVYGLAWVFGVAAYIALFVLGFVLVRDAQQRLVTTQQQNDRNQKAILRLLDEMADLADGDLTAKATVTEDITGAIADSMNYTVDSMREVVATINATVSEVGRSVDESRNTSVHLAEASDDQARQIAAASAQVTDMADSIEIVSAEAGHSADEARHSVEIAHAGGATVRATIEGMDTIREQIQETSKRIKRLGESSQEIGDIVGLITDISDQTNILALNAAIQASMAGDAGRGFAVVADEVQRLAERTGDATKQISTLVKTIQSDTNEAVSSMEESTTEVVRGAKQAEDAGRVLGQIETVSKSLAESIQKISVASSTHVVSATEVSDAMNSIQGITMETSKGTRAAAASLGELMDLAEALRGSVAGFKMPEGSVSPQHYVAPVTTIDITDHDSDKTAFEMNPVNDAVRAAAG
ncbi:MAG: chemotaxis protein [Gammaproteobacteria bacterium]|nr:chemotaxis protein [Gammaproteobacteria bacterium]